MGMGLWWCPAVLHRAEGAVLMFAALHKGCSFPQITPGAAVSGFFQCLCPFSQQLLPVPRAAGQSQGREGDRGDVERPSLGAARLCALQGGLIPLCPTSASCRVSSLSPGKFPTVLGMSSDMGGLSWGQRWGV